MIRILGYLTSLVLMLPLLWLAPASGSPHITGVRFWSAPDHTRFVFDIGGEVSYTYFSLSDPDRFVIDFKNATVGFKPESIIINDAVVRQVRFGYFKTDVFRVVCDLSHPAEVTIFAPERVKGKSDRLVFELFRPDLRAQSEQSRQKVSRESHQKKIIVIDPGHGGEDPGAIGPGGTREKDVVLGFARSLKDLFNEQQGCEAILTRRGDYFLSLRERTRIAVDCNADLFISIHADSNHNKKLTGSSVYCLSLQGASDEATRCLAEKENEADLVGGIRFTQNDDLNFTLLDLALTSTINSSLRYGSLVLQEIHKVHTVKFEQPKQAGFVVLKTAEMPSILVELGFLSNPGEEKKLKEHAFCVSVGCAIVTASDDFLSRLAEKDHSNQQSLTVTTTEDPLSL